MPIVESRIDKTEPQRPGRERVWFYFRDHTGRVSDPKLDVPVGFDAVAYLVRHEAFLNVHMIESEAELVESLVLEGDDPDAITTDHITAAEKLRAVATALMQGQAQQVFRAAVWLDGKSNTQIDRAIGASRRVLIRNRITSVLALRAGLEADEALRDG